MKHFLTILIFFTTSLGLFAAGYGNSNLRLTKDTVYLSGNSSQELSNVNHVLNTGSSSIDLKWEVIETTVPATWALGLCDKLNCFNLDGTSHNYTLAAGDSSIMDLTVSPNNVTGSGIVRIAIYPVNGSVNDGVIITHIINIKPPVSINAATAVNFTMFPNPVKDYLNINFSRKGIHHIEVYNILGNKILVKDISNADFLRIPFTNYQRGRYIIMYRSENGRVITKSISKE